MKKTDSSDPDRLDPDKRIRESEEIAERLGIHVVPPRRPPLTREEIKSIREDVNLPDFLRFARLSEEDVDQD
ncbi:MAG: hypothetical protein LBO79_10485 [Zoogloeaceae bacterium]|jgi:hypothetical protein|nr:hypothetical protein [Zoogloeaceae bacterium]